MTTLLQTRVLPSPADLAEIIDQVDTDLAASLREAIARAEQAPAVRLLGVHEGVARQAVATRSSVEVVAVSVEWLHVSWAAAATRHRGATVVQVARGGLDGGEGWAQVEQHVMAIAASPDEAAAAAVLIAAGALPRLAHTVDL